MAVLYDYPLKAAFGGFLPKEKIYAYGEPSRAIRNLFVSQVGKIVWRHKLAPETINLPARSGVQEIQVFDVTLKTGELSEEVLRCIDKAIPFPIFYQLLYGEWIKMVSAYKRPRNADSTKWVVGGYFESDWISLEAERTPLPIALDLAGLYAQMLRKLMPLSPKPGESLKDHVERLEKIRTRKKECEKLEARLQKEKQFNRKVELNAQLRVLKNELQALSS